MAGYRQQQQVYMGEVQVYMGEVYMREVRVFGSTQRHQVQVYRQRALVMCPGRWQQ
jgi:hypothetical protein